MRRGVLVGIGTVGLMALLCAQRLLWVGTTGLDGVQGYGPFPRISGNGRYIVTSVDHLRTDCSHPVIWMQESGWWYLKRDGGLTRNPREAMCAYADAITYDGSVVFCYDTSNGRPFRWRWGVGIEYLPLPPGATGGVVRAVSWDGNWIMGEVDYWTVRWPPSGLPERITGCSGVDISASGREIAGNCYFQAFHWREGEGIRYWPFLGVDVISGDGRMTFGAARWIVDEGRVEPLWPGGPRSMFVTIGASFDGRMAVGAYQLLVYPHTTHFFLWEEGVGIRTLEELYPEFFRYLSAELSSHSMTPDGRYILLTVINERRLIGQMVILDRFGIPGDVNGDDCVDDADLLRVLFAFGEEAADIRGETADVNADMVVDEADLLVVLQHFGQGCGH